MKIAISSNGESLDSSVDQRFGRCSYFLIVNIENNKIVDFKAIQNEGAIQGHGAGIRAAKQVGDENVDVIITGQLGPNATSVLSELDVKAYSASGTIKETIDNFIGEKLELISEVAEAHNGLKNVESDVTETSEERIFFPLLNDNGLDSEISQHFGHAPFFGLYRVDTKVFKIIKNDLDHTDPTKSPIDQIEEAVNPTTIFAKGIGGRAIGIIQEKGLGLKTGNYSTVKEVIDNLDKLEDQMKSCGHEH